MIGDKQKTITEAFAHLNTEAVYQKLLQYKSYCHIEDRHAIETNVFKGCSAFTHLYCYTESNVLKIQADSDSAIVRAIIGVMVFMFQDESPNDVLSFDFNKLLENIGLLSVLTMKRHNGIANMVAHVREFCAHSLF